MAHPDAVRLIEYCLNRAKKSLWAVGKVEPFAATLGTHGELSLVKLPETEGKTSPKELIEGYSTALKTEASAAKAIAVALCRDGRILCEGNPQVKPNDEIRLIVEHRQADAVEVQVPFRKTWWLGYAYSDMVAVKRQREFFSGMRRTY